jgi:hypothetical protein
MQYLGFASEIKEAVMFMLLMGWFMHYAIEMGSGAMTNIPNFITIGLRIHKLIGHTYTHRGMWYHKPTFIFFFQNKESRLETNKLILVSTGNITKSGQIMVLKIKDTVHQLLEMKKDKK